MDPTQQLNALRQYMNFYYQNLMSPNRARPEAGIYGSMGGNSDMNQRGAMQFAEGMMGGNGQNGGNGLGMVGGQDVFGSQNLPQFVQPQQFQAPQPQAQQHAPLLNDVNNYLRNIIRGRS